MKKTVFLAGPMRGVPRLEQLAWRTRAAELLSPKFNVLHALRGREEKETMPDPRGAVIRDKGDIQRADIILVNDMVKEVPMIGTAMEVLYAFERDKVVIAFGEAHKGNYFLDAHIHMRVANLDVAVQVLNDLYYL